VTSVFHVTSLVAALVALGVIGALIALACGAVTPTGFALATFVTGYATLVLATYLLSLLDAVTRGGMAVALVIALAVAGMIWIRAGRRRPRSVQPGLRELRQALRDPVLAIGAAATLAAAGYSLALLLFTPQNEGDALAYHLPRAMLWRQQHAVGYVGDVIETRLNVNPPNAEIGTLLTMVFSGVDRYVGLVQYVAYVVATVGVYAIARRVGFTRRQSLFGAFVFALFPVVAMQASGALNDLVVASFLVCAAVFVLSPRDADLWLAALALGLALGTKFTGVFGIPFLIALAMLGPARRHWRSLVVPGLAAVAIGSVWYIVNLVETGKLEGGLNESANQTQYLTPGWIIVTAGRLMLDGLDASGTGGSETLAYVVAAEVLAIGSIAARVWRRTPDAWALLKATIPVAVIPYALLATGIVFKSALREIVDAIGGDDLTGELSPGRFQLSGVADTTRSWYGPTGTMLAIVLPAIALRGRLWRSHGWSFVLLAVAPTLALVELAFILVYDPWRGRFLVFGAAFGAAAGALLLDRRALAWITLAVAVTATTMSFVNFLGKPSGLSDSTTVWGKPRWFVESFLRSDSIVRERDEGRTIHWFEEHVPARTNVALAPLGNDLLSPYFGSSLSRHVSLVRSDGGVVGDTAKWLVIASSAHIRLCPGDWTTRFALRSGWRIEERTGNRGCATPSPA
jgi:4-amino-4-deoxy-L-arabinose transferase-like glycosyltransferase